MCSLAYATYFASCIQRGHRECLFHLCFSMYRAVSCDFVQFSVHVSSNTSDDILFRNTDPVTLGGLLYSDSASSSRGPYGTVNAPARRELAHSQHHTRFRYFWNSPATITAYSSTPKVTPPARYFLSLHSIQTPYTVRVEAAGPGRC